MTLEAFRQFRHCPRCGARSADQPDANPFRCAGCGFELFFNAAAAVAAFVLDRRGWILYTRRAQDPGKGRLGMPGGFVDLGETAEDALRREVREEVGLEVGPLEYLASFPNRYSYGGVLYRTLDLFFVAPTDQAERARAIDGTGGLVWLDPGDVDPAEIAFDSMRRALAVFTARSRADER